MSGQCIWDKEEESCCIERKSMHNLQAMYNFIRGGFRKNKGPFYLHNLIDRILQALINLPYSIGHLIGKSQGLYNLILLTFISLIYTLISIFEHRLIIIVLLSSFCYHPFVIILLLLLWYIYYSNIQNRKSIKLVLIERKILNNFIK